MKDSLEKNTYHIWESLKIQRDKIVRRPISILHKLGVSADHLSIFGFLLGILSLFFLNNSRILFFLLWGANRIVDCLDGPLSRLGGKKIITGCDVDKVFDFSYYFLLLIFATPSAGFTLTLVTTALSLIHIFLDHRSIGKKILAPNNYAQYFFIFGLFKFGMLFQISFTSIAMLGFLLNLRKGKD